MAARPPPPVSQQMEQIDQQIVALLQDIDEAFSNLHQTVATRLIPAVKRFNHNAEPTREFAKVRAPCQLDGLLARGEPGDGWRGRSGERAGRRLEPFSLSGDGLLLLSCSPSPLRAYTPI